MNDSLPKLLLQRSKGRQDAVLWGREAEPYFGRAFDRLMADGLLTERAPATTWPTCSTCEDRCDGRDVVIIGDQLVAECPEDHRCNTVLAPHDVRSFTIDPEVLVRLIAKASDLEGAPFLLTAGAWKLGRTSASGRTVVLILDPTAGRNPDLVTLLRGEALGSCAVTVLMPPGMPHVETRPLKKAGFHVVATVDALANTAGDSFCLVTSALNPVAVRDAQLILQSASSSIVIFGRQVKLSRRRFEVAEALAEAASRRAVASRRDIERKLYGSQSVDNKLVADAVRDLRDAIASALPVGVSPTDFIQTRTNQGYTLGIEHDLIRFDP